MNIVDLEKNHENNLEIASKQNNFLESKLGNVINKGINLGLKMILPDIIENEIIDIKDTLIRSGISEGIKKAIDSAVELGKSVIGIATGNFENVKQVQTAIKKGGIIDSVGLVIDKAVSMGIESGKISNNIGKTIEKGKDTILRTISNNIENEFQSQLQNIEKIEKYTDNWKNYYSGHDFEGMQREYEKIQEKLKDVFPIEKTINNARTVLNLHKLIKSKGKNFNLSEVEVELSKIL